MFDLMRNRESRDAGSDSDHSNLARGVAALFLDWHPIRWSLPLGDTGGIAERGASSLGGLGAMFVHFASRDIWNENVDSRRQKSR